MQPTFDPQETSRSVPQTRSRSKTTLGGFLFILSLLSLLALLSNGSIVQAAGLNGLFQPDQTIPTPNGVIDWEHFEIGGVHYLISASNGLATDSKLYELINGTFVEMQSIPTNRPTGWEHFVIDGNHYLAVANNFDGSSGNTDSAIYLWNNSTSQLELHQEIATSRAYDWEYFMIGNDHFLAMANFYDGASYSTDSKIYKWDSVLGQFDDTNTFQEIATTGAAAWDHFTIGADHYLALASYVGDGPIFEQESKIYKWDTVLGAV